MGLQLTRNIINAGWLQNMRAGYLLVVLSCCLLAGCETLNFYSQAIAGQLSILAKRESIQTLLAKSQLDEAQARRFALIKDMLQFAEQELQLPVGKTFSSYTDLQRDYVVWNVFAAPRYSVEPFEWCYPVAGCTTYRGYFSESKARNYASKLAAKGFDTYVAGVKAYSTLGWFNDPILNTFMAYSDTQLAALVFHELAHKVVYIPGDTDFNESFARTVEIAGVQRWLAARNANRLFAAYQQRLQVHEQFVVRVQGLREKLQEAYVAASSSAEKQRAKVQIFARFELEISNFLQQYPSAKRYRTWLDEVANNAKLVPISSYNRWVPAFESMLGSDMTEFFDHCKELAEMDESSRDDFLLAQTPAGDAETISF